MFEASLASVVGTLSGFALATVVGAVAASGCACSIVVNIPSAAIRFASVVKGGAALAFACHLQASDLQAHLAPEA